MSVSFEEAYVASKLYVQEHNDLKNRFVQPLKYKEDFLSEELDFVWFRNLRTTIANVKQNYMQETIPADFLQLDRDIEAQAESLQRAFNSYVHTVESNAHKAESKNKLDVLAKDIRIIHKFADEYNFAHPKFIEVERDIAIKYNHMLTYPHEYGLQKKIRVCKEKTSEATYLLFEKMQGSSVISKNVSSRIKTNLVIGLVCGFAYIGIQYKDKIFTFDSKQEPIFAYDHKQDVPLILTQSQDYVESQHETAVEFKSNTYNSPSRASSLDLDSTLLFTNQNNARSSTLENTLTNTQDLFKKRTNENKISGPVLPAVVIPNTSLEKDSNNTFSKKYLTHHASISSLKKTELLSNIDLSLFHKEDAIHRYK